ncbi:Fic family protein [Gemmatimonadota bacterium]
MQRTAGTYVNTSVRDETVRAFLPHPLPPDPDLSLSPADNELLQEANWNLGKLDGVIPSLNIPFLTYMNLRKEAVLSSQIEGTQASLSDLLLHESAQKPGVPLDDVMEVSRYVSAMNWGLERMQGGFPLSNRLIREIHGLLLRKGRGSASNPGEFRRSQNWIGGSRPGNARYVPPPWEQVEPCMSDLEKFIHDIPHRTPSLIKSALAHVQFETIHPFLDGNGRIGRLLITLILCGEGVLSEPVLYLSLFIKQNREQYYVLLNQVRTDGDWEAWFRFFLEGVNDTSVKAVQAANDIQGLFQNNHDRLSTERGTSSSSVKVHEYLKQRPIISIRDVSDHTGLAFQTALTTLDRLSVLGIVEEITGKQRNRLYVYSDYMNLLNEGTEPIQ